MQDSSYKIEIQPRWRDTDALGHVNNAVYLSYVEIARLNWYMGLGFDASFKDFSFILKTAELDFKIPITLKSKPIVELWVSHIGTKSWTFNYKIYEKTTDVVYATAKTVLVNFDYETQTPIVMSAEIIEILNRLKRD